MKLKLPKDKFAIFGSGPLAIRNLRDNKDTDIIVKDNIWSSLIKKYPLEEGRYYIKIRKIEIFNKWPIIKNKDKIIDDADIFNGIRFVKLKHVLKGIG